MFKSNWFIICWVMAVLNLIVLLYTKHPMFYTGSAVFLCAGIICDAIVEAVNYMKKVDTTK